MPPPPPTGDDPFDAFDLRQELLAAFEDEYRDHLTAMRRVLEGGIVSGAALRDVFRRAHSLKGAARAVDLPRIEQIAHDLETLLFVAVESARALDAAETEAVGRGLDSIEAAMLGDPASGPAEPVEPAPAPDALPDPGASAAPDSGSRVSSREIDRLVESVQAASDAMLGQEQGRQWLGEHRDALQHLVRLCDALPHDRGTAGIAAGLRALLRSASTRLREGRHEDWQREQTVSALRAQVERVALVSADSVFGSLAAMARELGRERDAEIAVRFEGLELRADRPVLQALRDPVIQLLRNAVAHGLARRLARAGAPGEVPPAVELRVFIRGGQLRVEVSDNGDGPDLAAIAARARAQGLLHGSPNEPPGDERAVLALCFEPGFSTATEVDRLSGRGMGLSIVAEAARRLGGSAHMETLRDPGGRVSGTLLAMAVPLSARRQAVVLVEAGGHVLALPSEAVSRLRTVAREALEQNGAELSARIAVDRTLPVRSLCRLLGLPDAATGDAERRLVVMKGPDGEFGLLVDRFRAVSSLTVRPPAIIGVDRALVGGVALLGDNRPVLVLEPDGVRDAWVRQREGGAPDAAVAGAGAAQRRRTTILVVDDSITTRTLEKTILQAQGYTVLIAVDGLEALDVLRSAEREIDIVLADVEMPRLDGFGLVAAMQADPSLRKTPIVLMTSRNDQADIQRGLELGASAYLTKQEFEQGMLLSVIGQLLP